jgi:cytochrome P450
MQYTLKHLALHPTVQTDLYTEIQSVCGDRLPEFSDLTKLVYALCIMYETMRLHPVIGSLSLTVASNHDESLLGKYTVPKDTFLGLDLYSTHRNEKYWGETANEFNPSRFDNREGNDGRYSADEKTKMPVRGAFFGFFEGPRACLGMFFTGK